MEQYKQKQAISDIIPKGKPIFVRAEERNYIQIRFDKLFNRDISYLNKFCLKKKRTYYNISDIIINYNNALLEKDKSNIILVNYLAMKYKIDKGHYTNSKQFIDELYTTLFTDKLIQNIRDFVDENYTYNLDEKTVDKYIAGLQFTDNHAKILHMISTATKLIIPLVMEYLTYDINFKDDLNEFIISCFDPLFDIFETKDTDILNKLYQSVYSRVVTTRYSDCSFWNYCTSMGFGITDLTNTLIKKILVDIIPKYQFNKNIISLNHVVINNSIDYTFRYNFPINYKPINLGEADEEGLTDFDRLAINTARVNESILVLNKINVNFTIKYLLDLFKLKISKNEFEYYFKHLKLNKLQRSFIFLFFSKYFGSVDAIYSCNFKQYIYLIIIMKKILRKNKFLLLDKIITAKVQNMKEKKILNKKNLYKILESKKFRDLIEEKYKYTSYIINESNMIIKSVATILSNRFLMNDFKKSKRNGKLINIDVDLLISEFFRFLNLI